MARPPLVGQDILTVEASRLHADTPHSVGILWTNDQPNAETWRLTTLTSDRNGSVNENGYPNKFELKSFSSLSAATSIQTEAAHFFKCTCEQRSMLIDAAGQHNGNASDCHSERYLVRIPSTIYYKLTVWQMCAGLLSSSMLMFAKYLKSGHISWIPRCVSYTYQNRPS